MNFKKITDPFSAREAQKYSDPIPSREYILSVLQAQENKVIRSRRELEALLFLEEATQKEALRRRIRAMSRDGQIIWKKGKGYFLPKDSVFLKGKVLGTKEGFGFVEPEDKSPNLFLNARQMRQVFPNDRVLVRIVSEHARGRREASIVEILDRNTENVLGRYSSNGDTLKVTPINPRTHQVISIPSGYQADALDNQIVLAEIIKQPGLHHPSIGRIIKILGDSNSPGIASLLAIYQYQLPYEWSLEVEEEIKDLKVNAEVLLNQKNARIDLRHLPFMTIDGEDSKDFDDAVYCTIEKNHWKLWVAIADVSHYVKPDTSIDQEAQLRGNSVYFPDQVVAMLPELLSNDWCSLKPNVDRFCLVCEMTITQKGKLKQYQFYPAILQSKARLTYSLASEYLSSENYAPMHQMIAAPLQHLKNLYSILHQVRVKRGSIDFDLKETRLVLDTQGNIKSIEPSSRTIAHRIIEECMLMANVAAAQFLIENEVPSLFRIHEPPTAEKVLELQTSLKSLGYQLHFKKQSKPSEYAKLLQAITQDSKAHIIHMMILRTMNQAIYSPINKGHFGLAYSEYTHFTSPIRRYSDLIVHRSIYALLDQKKHTKREKQFHYNMTVLEKLSAHCSVTERRADEATRMVKNYLKCQYIKHYIGKSFKGTISHITGFGLFVELEHNQIEGLIHISHLQDDHYVFDAKNMQLRGQNHSKTYQLGDLVCVEVVHVNAEAREIDFKLCEF